jgi:hypothetical protein
LKPVEIESAAATTSSSPTRDAAKMATGEVPVLLDFFKKTTIFEVDRTAYHTLGWLTSNLISFIPEVEIPTVEGSVTICSESHLYAGLGLPPSKFLSSIMNYLGCGPVHFNPNVIAALSSFMMLCECWLGIAPDSSLFWYFYSPCRYGKVIFGGIGLSLRRHHCDEYINASFKGCWKGAQQKWILVEMQSSPSWENKLLYPPIVDGQRKEPPMSDRLRALIKRVTELRQAGLGAYHCIEELHLQ